MLIINGLMGVNVVQETAIFILTLSPFIAKFCIDFGEQKCVNIYPGDDQRGSVKFHCGL